MIGNKIRELRVQQGVSQRQLAGRDMTRAFISLVEKGRATPSPRTLAIIAQRLGKPVEYFLADSEQTEGEEDLGRAIIDAARFKADAGDHQAAIRLVRRLFQTTKNPSLVVEARALLVDSLVAIGDLTQAMEECELMVDGYLELGDRAGVVRSYMRKGYIAYMQEEFPLARWAYQGAVKYSRELKSLQDKRGDALISLGSTLLQLGDLEEAIDVYQEAFDEACDLGSEARQGAAAMGMGKAYFKLNDLRGARMMTLKAIEYLGQCNSPDQVLAIHNLAAIGWAAGNHSEALAGYEKCLAIYREQGRVDKQASLLEDLARHWIEQGDFAKAKACCRNALALLDVKDNGVLRGLLYRLLGTICQKEGDLEQSYYFLRMSYDLLRRIKASQEAATSMNMLRELPTMQPDV